MDFYYIVILVDEGVVQQVFEWDDYDCAKKEAVKFAATCIRLQKESDSYAQIWERAKHSSTAFLVETLPEQ